MENLKPLRRYQATQIFGAFFIVVVLAALTAVTLLSVLDKPVYAYASAAGIALVGAFVAAIILGKSLLAPTDFLARAILHVSRSNSTVGAPDPRSLPASQDFFENLAKNVYEMASGAPLAAGLAPQSDATFQKTLLQNSPLAIYSLDKDEKLTFLNQAGAEYTQINAKDALGQKFYDVLKLSFAGEGTLESWLKESENQRATGIHTWDRVKLELPDGSLKQCDMAVRFNKDNPDGVETVIILFDHTERYSTDDHGANFISMAVHELRTPLTIMRGYIEVFEDEVGDKLDSEQAEFMRNLSAQAQQLAAFVSNVQNFARIEGSELSLALKEESWPSIVESAVKDMELRARVRHKILKLEISPDIPAVAVDRTTIFEVLINLIENAVKYTHNDEPIVIRTYKKDENFVETTIEDKGIGIPDALIGHVFEKFYRSHRSNKSVGGTGLGLYLSKAIVSAHGGEIWLKSKEGEGSTFGFTIPTLSSVADQVNSSDNKAIIRGAHGWIKNHSLYRN